MAMPPKVILSIAGSDPSGGAGIQADLKTISSLGLFGCAAISALTVQNTEGVYRVEPVAPELLRAQIDKVLADMPVSHIKTGMTGSGAVAQAIGESLASIQGVLVCDPVLKASSGYDLLPPTELAVLSDHLISRATALTKDIPRSGKSNQIPDGEEIGFVRETADELEFVFDEPVDLVGNTRRITSLSAGPSQACEMFQRCEPWWCQFLRILITQLVERKRATLGDFNGVLNCFGHVDKQ